MSKLGATIRKINGITTFIFHREEDAILFHRKTGLPTALYSQLPSDPENFIAYRNIMAQRPLYRR